MNPFSKPAYKGIVKRHPDGFGFFIPDESELPDVYIPRKHMVGVMSNDKIQVQVRPEPGGERFRGKVIRIVERSTAKVVGQIYMLNDEIALLRDDNHGWGEDLSVELNGFAVDDGEWVSVQIDTYPGSHEGFSGRLIKVIGDGMDPLNDIMRVVQSQGIPDQFSKECIEDSEKLQDELSEQEFKNRKDLRDVPLITIDGSTAKDFDDAIFVDMTDRGFHLIVAIADVSHYVKPNSVLDDEAWDRGNSTYFPNFCIPMLPEKLSNELCSLKPLVPRLALVADMKLDFQGEVESSEIYEAVIKSHARVTYGEAQEVIDGSTPEEFKSVEAVIKKAADLAKILMAKRFREGSLDLEIPETEIEVDDAGEPVDILKAERLFSHRLIEEMMLTANVVVAKYFKSQTMEAIYRIHEKPDYEDIQVLERFLQAFGSDKKLSGGKLQKKITRALQNFAGHPQEHILSILTLRSMSQAKYSPDNVGHFGLGFEDYTHFTSPIRRYPDLIVHRLLKSSLIPQRGYQRVNLEDLDRAGTWFSSTEQRSVKAERQLVSIKKARFMIKHVGEEFEGTISSVAKFGVFVLLRRFDVDGMIRLEELPGGPFIFEEERLELVGKRSGVKFSIGDPIKVLVTQADPDEGKIDFAYAGELEIATHNDHQKKPSKKRRKTKKNR